MRTSKFLIVVACAPLFACTNPQPAKSSPATTEDDDLAQQVDAIPTQDEADQQATKQINADNADAELEKLLKEINSSSDGGG